MNKIQKYILSCTAAFTLLTLTGCYTDFEPKLDSTPVVCINALITEGEPITAKVSRTWRYSDLEASNNPYSIYLQDSEVKLFVNDEFVCTMQPKEEVDIRWGTVRNRYFESDYIPKIGDKIRIEAHNEKYGDAWGETLVPDRPVIDKTDTGVSTYATREQLESDDFNVTFSMNLRVTFTDDATATNYYIFDISAKESFGYFDENGEYHNPLPESLGLDADFGSEPLFSEHISPLETVISDAKGLYTVFSDRQISGKSYTLKVPMDGRYYWDDSNHTGLGHRAEIYVNLYHISPAYYNYMMSLWATTEGISGALGGVGLGDAVWETSNVSTGAGVVVARTPATVTLSPYELLLDATQ